MTRTLPDLTSLFASKGEEIGVSEWSTVTQEQIDTFAAATHDHQWIHTDPERAVTGPYGSTIAHGFLTLSLIPYLCAGIQPAQEVSRSVNYGLNRVRFPQPVKVGSRVRARSVLLDVVEKENCIELTSQVTIEVEGTDKPACVAEVIGRLYP